MGRIFLFVTVSFGQRFSQLHTPSLQPCARSATTMSASPPPKPGPEFWDQRYGEEEFAYGTDPNVFLKESSPQISSSGNVLCLAEGET
jgi:hypothetical protein